MSATQNSLDLHGVFPPIPTPFGEDEAITFDHLGENLDRWSQIPLTGYVVGGSNGEFVSLSERERLEVLRFVCANVDSRRPVIAGSGLHSTRETLKQTKAMAEAGAQAALVVTPSYYKTRMEPDALIAHYTTIADESPIPIILYNVPANTGIDMSAKTILPLSKHANIIGLKDSSGDLSKLAEIIEHASAGFQALAGSASFLLGALSVGAVGTISALANVAGEALQAMLRAFESENLDLAGQIQRKLVRPNAAVTARFGVAGLKYALTLNGFYGGPPRAPLLPLTTDQQSVIKRIFKDAELLEAS